MKKPSFVDESTECAICYESLEAGKVITLRCGHKWHLDCIIQQIKCGSMTASNDDKRLLFNGCQCGKCASIFGEEDHPDLPKDLLRSTDKLRSKVNKLIAEHNLLEEIQSDSEKKTMSKTALHKEAMRKYAFYLCSHCKDPYFGGTIECADEMRQQDTTTPETRLCPACAPQSQTICQNPSEHGRYLIWKCRYCCKPSTHVCYGNVHFCNDCHKRHSLTRKQIKAIPCPGNSCCHPKPTEFHSNGPSPDCEQVYSCALCESIGNSDGGMHDPHAIAAGSRNFIVNPNGEEGLNGWERVSRARVWSVERHSEQRDIPPLVQTPVMGFQDRPPITTNFVSNFQDCVMQQIVDLKAVLRLGTPNQNIPRTVRIEVSARYTGRTDCPSVFALQAALYEGQPGPSSSQRPRITPPQRKFTGALDAPPGVYWERASHEFELDTTGNTWRRPMISVVVMGKDKRFWAGNFGSKVADITVRVVGLNAEEMEALVKPRNGMQRAVENGQTNANNANNANNASNRDRNNQNNNENNRNRIDNNNGNNNNNNKPSLWATLACLAVIFGVFFT